MENGDIKEVGDHESLMALGGKYTVLDNRQFAKVDVSDKMHFDLF